MSKLIISNGFEPAGVETYRGLVDNTYVFNVEFNAAGFGSDNIDSVLHNFILYNLNNQKFEVLFIPVFIGKSFSDFLGLRLGMHIRFTGNKNQHTAIVFYSSSPLDEICRHSSSYQIIFQKNSYFCDLNVSCFNSILGKSFLDLIEEDIFEIANNISLTLPPNYYNSSHDLSNEWSIIQWAKAISTTDEENNSLENIGEISNIRKKIDSLLYYKYLAYKIRLASGVERENYEINVDSKIIYIDDEWSRGWGTVFKHLFKKSKAFKIFEYEFKNKETTTIINDCFDYVVNEKADIVILDLRLAKYDFNEDSTIEETSGYLLLDKIKEENKGIQVIVFTASNKVWNLLELQKVGINGFILKESPEDIANLGYTNNTIEALIDLTTERSRYIFQKNWIYILKSLIEKLNSTPINSNEEFKVFITELKTQLRLSLNVTSIIDLKEPFTMDLTFLSYYIILEQFKKHYPKSDTENKCIFLGSEKIISKRYIDKENNLIEPPTVSSPSGENGPALMSFIPALLVDYFKVIKPTDAILKGLSEVIHARNDFVHAKRKHITQQETKTLLEILVLLCQELRP